jgi:hypothetical protein
VAGAALIFKDLLFHSLVGWAPGRGEGRRWITDSRPEAVAVVIVIHIADFVGPTVAVLIDVITPTRTCGLSDLDTLETVGAVRTGVIEVTILVIETGET